MTLYPGQSSSSSTSKTVSSGLDVSTDAAARDWSSDRSPVVPLLETVAEFTGQKRDQLEPLYSAIDPDALETMVASDHRASDVQVSFGYEGCRVTVSNTKLVVQSTAATD